MEGAKPGEGYVSAFGEAMVSHGNRLSRTGVSHVQNIVDVLVVPEYRPSVLQWSAVWKEGSPNLVYLTLECIFETPVGEVAI